MVPTASSRTELRPSATLAAAVARRVVLVAGLCVLGTVVAGPNLVPNPGIEQFEGDLPANQTSNEGEGR